MFKFKKVEEMKSKVKKVKIAAMSFGVVFFLMILNLIYLNVKVAELVK